MTESAVDLLRRAAEAAKTLAPGARELADALVALAREWGWASETDDGMARLNTEAQVGLQAVLALAGQQNTTRTGTVGDDVREVLEYVSRGRRYVDVQPYPDFEARRALGALGDAAGQQPNDVGRERLPVLVFYADGEDQ